MMDTEIGPGCKKLQQMASPSEGGSSDPHDSAYALRKIAGNGINQGI